MTYSELEECESHLTREVQENEYIGHGGNRAREVLLLKLAFGSLELLLELGDLHGEIASELHEDYCSDLAPHQLLLVLRAHLGCFCPALGQCPLESLALVV